jgi:hypothetical protein
VPPADVDSAGIAEIGARLDANHVPMIAHPPNSVIGRTIIDNNGSQREIPGPDRKRIQHSIDIESTIIGNDDDGAVNVAPLT